MSQITVEPAAAIDAVDAKGSTADRIGVVASVLCAIHCAVTPFLLLLLPTFGKAWSHPATHWGMALLVVPLAGFMVRSSFKKHGRKWVVAAGSLGILFILSGAAAPYLEEPPPESTAAAATAAVKEETEATAGEEEECECCKDSCCPTLEETEDGSWKLHIPTASILTTLGGAFLIVTHIANLKLCSCVGCDSGE